MQIVLPQVKNPFIRRSLFGFPSHRISQLASANFDEWDPENHIKSNTIGQSRNDIIYSEYPEAECESG